MSTLDLPSEGLDNYLTLLYFAVFSVVSARERRAFWSTRPSRWLIGTLTAEALVGTAVTRVGLPDLQALPWAETAGIFAYALVACLLVNDLLKVGLIRWRIPTAVA